MTLRSTIKKHTPWPLHYLYRKLYYAPQDVPAAVGFVFHTTKSPTTFLQRLRLVGAFYHITYKVESPHTEHELITIARQMLDLGPDVPGALVEAGAFHGSSTAKFSLVADLCGRTLHVFDSFEGMPENTEEHGKSIYGREHHFPKGSHAVGLEEVKYHVERYGKPEVCVYHKGFFSETMPSFKETVALACINADLVQSTRDCLVNLFPLLAKGGAIVSQDAHFPWIIELLQDGHFWKDELHVPVPHMDGLGKRKFVTISPTEPTGV